MGWPGCASWGEPAGLPGCQASCRGETSQPCGAGAWGKTRHGVEDRREVTLGVGPRARLTWAREGSEVGGRRGAQDLQGLLRPWRHGDPGAYCLAVDQAHGPIRVALADALVEVEHVLQLPAGDRLGGPIALGHRLSSSSQDGG